MLDHWGGRAALAALVTPLDGATGAIDHGRQGALALELVARGLDGVVAFGTTGEGPSFTANERLTALRALLSAGLPPQRLVAGVASPALSGAIEEARHCLDLGVAGLLVPPPFYYKGVSQAGVIAWYSAFIEGLGTAARDIIVYNIPSVTAVDAGPQVVAALRARFGGVIVAAKDSSGDPAVGRAFLALQDVPVMIGHEGFLAPFMAAGAVGTISGLANIAPERIAAVVRAGASDPGLPGGVDAVLAHPVVPAVRALLARARSDDAWRLPRLPQEPLPPQACATLYHAWDGQPWLNVARAG